MFEGNKVEKKDIYNIGVLLPLRFEELMPQRGRWSNQFILDIYEGIACVKVESFEIVDYLQLAKYNGNWKIINVLWTMKAEE